MKSYFHKHSDVKIRLKKCGKKTHIGISCKRGKLIWGLIMVIALVDKNILGHRLVDGWTRWVACAYSEVVSRQTQNREAKRAGVQWIS